MSILIRKINKAKWLQSNIDDGEQVSADAITNCIKTTSNTLSVWVVDSIEQIDDAALAILGAHESLDTIDLVAINIEDVEKKGILVEATPGKTRVRDQIEKHRDLSQLKYSDLGTIAEIVVKELIGQRVYRYTKGKQKVMLKTAIDSQRINYEDLPESIQTKLGIDAGKK